MKPTTLFILLAVAFSIAAPTTVCAKTFIMIDGVALLDSDDDGVVDIDAQGDPVDDCPLARNGDCNKDPANCDINGDGKLSKQELAAGNQADWNHNYVDDACDDSDKDGVVDYLDNCRTVSNPDQNPKACIDTDSDGLEDDIDNCPAMYNSAQEDTDGDKVGDWCDNCRTVYNPDQKDSNKDAIGDSCPPKVTDRPAAVGSTSTFEGPELPSTLYAQGNNGCSFVSVPASRAGVFFLLFAIAGMAELRRKNKTKKPL